MQARDVKCWVPEAPTECLVSGLRVVRGAPVLPLCQAVGMH